MRPRFHVILIVLAVCACLAPAATRADEDAPMGAGTAIGGWVVLPYPDTRPITPSHPEPGPPSPQLYFLPADSPPGALYGAMALPALPHAIAASGARVMLLFPPRRPGADKAGWTVRALSAIDQPEPLPPLFDPPGRLEVLPALQTEGEIIDLVGAPGGGGAVLVGPVQDATGAPIGVGHELFILTDGQWRAAALPAQAFSGAAPRLLASPEGVSALYPDQSSGRAILWTGSLPGEVSDEEETLRLQWRSTTIEQPASDAILTMTSGGHVLSATRSDGGQVRLRLHLTGSTTDIATIEGVPTAFAMARVGDTVAITYLSDDPQPRIMIAAVHASTGEILHEGAHKRISPISPDDLQFLGIVLGLVLVTALVFVFRPAPAVKGVVAMPPGVALASPERRLAAGLIDLAIPLSIVAELMDHGPFEILTAPFTLERTSEFWPFAMAMGGFFAHTVLSEWLFAGMTLGKWLLRIRVVSVLGGRATLWQCFCRNIIKLVCPPLLVMIFVDPGRRHPGDTLAGAMVVARARGGGTPDDEEDDDGPGRTNEAPV